MGFISAIVHDSGETKITLSLTGREIDFKDLERAIKFQNKSRKHNAIEVTYTKNLSISDQQLGDKIDEVVKIMLSHRFSEIIKTGDKKQSSLTEKYNNLDKNYKRTKDKEGFLSKDGSIGIYAPSLKMESILFASKGYYK